MEVKLETIDVAIDQEKMSGTLLFPAEALPAVLFVHGWGGSQEQDLARAKQAAALGTVSLTFDLRGHERDSPQSHTVTREQNLRDLLAAYDRLVKQRNVDGTSVAVIGVSYGGYLAAILSSMRPVRWLALRSPAIYKDEDWDLPKIELHRDTDLPAYRRRKIDAQDNKALRASSEFSGDVLIVEAENDEIVPREVAKNYAVAFSKAKSLSTRVVTGATHAFSDLQSQTAYNTILISWLTEMIVGGRGAAAKKRVERHVIERRRMEQRANDERVGGHERVERS